MKSGDASIVQVIQSFVVLFKAKKNKNTGVKKVTLLFEHANESRQILLGGHSGGGLSDLLLQDQLLLPLQVQGAGGLGNHHLYYCYQCL